MTMAFFGGTFDPPHLGHLHLAREALRSGAVSHILWVPAGTPPHKRGREISDFSARREMTELLTRDEPQMSVTDLEGTWGAGRPNFTVETLRELHRRRPAEQWRLLIGADMAITFDTWREPETILRLAPPLVAVRPGFVFPKGFGDTLPAGLSAAGRKILASGIFPAEPFDCASSSIRERLSAGRRPEGLAPAVMDYIIARKLYNSPTRPAVNTAGGAQ